MITSIQNMYVLYNAIFFLEKGYSIKKIYLFNGMSETNNDKN